MKRSRNVLHDNLGTDGHPVWRARYATPLTPRAVRNELAAQSMEQVESARDGWMQARLTPLDKTLDDDAAAALELYVLCEQILSGSARCGDYTGDRVQTSRHEMSPLPDDWLPKLAVHNARKMLLPLRDVLILQTFCEQMNGNGQSDAKSAIDHGLFGKDRSQSWVEAVRRVADRLVNL